MEWFRYFLFVGLFAASTSQQYHFSLTECNDRGTVDLVEGQAASITCTGLVGGHNIYWTKTSTKNVETTVGRCILCDDYPLTCFNCVNCNEACSTVSPNYQITRTEQSTTLHFNTVYHNDDGAVVKCSSKNNATQTSCTINVIRAYRIRNCVNNEVTVFENRNTNILCYRLIASQQMYWVITDSFGKSSRIAECGPCLNVRPCAPCSVLHTDYLAARTRVFSILRIANNKRQKNGWTLRCSEWNNTTSAQCNVRVQYPAELGHPSITLDGWNLTGSVVINKVYDSDNNIDCLWRVNGSTSINGLKTTPSVSSFVDSGNGAEYMNGTCMLSLPLNASDGVYYLVLTIRPGGTQLLVGNVSVEKPGALLLAPQTCPVFVAEETNLECPCRHTLTQQGSPSAFVTWTNGNNSTVLSVNGVHREQNGTVYTCRSVWGPKEEFIHVQKYTLFVAYGPTDAVVYSQTYVIDGTEIVTLNCTCDDVYPSVNISWSVPCMTFTLTSRMSTCSVAKATLDNITEVTCFAYNSKFKGVNTTYAYRQPVQNQDQNQALPPASVAGGVVAAVVVIGTIIVVVIIIVKRKRSSKSPRAEQNEEFVQYTNDLYASTGEVESSSSDVINSTHPHPSSLENANSPQNTDQSANPEGTYVNAGAAASAAMNHSGDVYATVAKKTKNEASDLQSNNPNETYAQVQKKKPQGDNSSGQVKSPAQKLNNNGKHGTGNEAGEQTTGLSKFAEVTEYANCPRESTVDNCEAVYMNMAQASSPEAKEEV
ncbi:uncharacterized protein, partial [Littorina saxatilis]|uniref:uncharacterized protein n=1 Tax=Littorina saxatilis TaxID=31220 RepID=UPI0038B62D6C